MSEDDKLSILDVLATDEIGRLFNIEMQLSVPAHMATRLSYYVSKIYAGQLDEGDEYHELRPAICICVLDKVMVKGSQELHLDYRFRDESGRVLTDNLQIHLLQLPNLPVARENLGDASPIERWCYFLTNAENMTLEEVTESFPELEIQEAAELLEMVNQTPEQRVFYDSRLKAQRDEQARILQGRLEGRLEGLAEGEARGRLIGRINLLRQLLKLSEVSDEEFARYEDAGLKQCEAELQEQLRSRGTDI